MSTVMSCTPSKSKTCLGLRVAVSLSMIRSSSSALSLLIPQHLNQGKRLRGFTCVAIRVTAKAVNMTVEDF